MKHILQIVTEDRDQEPVFTADIGERIPIDVQIKVLQAIREVPEPKSRKERSDKGSKKLETI